MKILLTAIVSVLFLSSAVQAGVCELTVDRTACPDKTEVAYEPYQKKNPTVEPKPVADAKACIAQAKKSCKIVRTEILSQKAVTAKFDGNALEGGANICKDIKESKSDCKKR